ncbi:MAG: DNA repair protein RecO [Steroidobacteraceae bacterium]|nr:DNA repair protein RecO [Steroidobacteraceae bacterium]
MSGTARRVQLAPAFLLHHYPWRDSSRILELLTREHGRVSVFARAARRGGSSLPAALQPFAELLVSWTARGEAGQLTGAERVRAAAPIEGDRLMSAFYANELLVKLLPRHDPHPALYDAYAALLARLADAAERPARALRLFEKRLLEELGWGLCLETEAAAGVPIESGHCYRYRIDGGPELVEGVAEGILVFSGASLLSLARDELRDERSLGDARRLLKAALDQCLDGRPLRTREVMIAMRAHGGAQGG